MIRRGTVIGLAAGAMLLAFAASASAVPGDLTYQGCITGDTEVGPDGSDACEAIPEATQFGEDSGLNDLESVAVSHDGLSVYVAAGSNDDAVAHFSRDPVLGTLTYVECFTGDTDVAGCTEVDSATVGGDNSGMGGPESVAVSPDGTNVYVTSRADDAIAQFSRDPASGALDYLGCDSGEEASIPPCDDIVLGTSGGSDSGFDDPKIKAVEFSADAEFVFAAGSEDDTIMTFERDTSTGELEFDSCITAENDLLLATCTHINGPAEGDNSGLNEPRWLAIGPEGTTLYAAATADDSIARFSVDAGGDLTFEDCLTGDTDVDACEEIPSATGDVSPQGGLGANSGLDDPRGFVISPDGEFAYAISGGDSAVLSFDRDPATGALQYLGCLTGNSSGPGSAGTGACSDLPTATRTLAIDSGFDGLRSMAISADGISLYTAAQFDDALATFDVNPATGVLAFDSCLTGNTEVSCTEIPSAETFGFASGFDDLETIALSPDDRSLYGAAERDDAVSTLAREPLPPALPEPDTANCQRDKVVRTNGTDGDDTLTGTPGKDAIFGLGGKDSIRGVGGPDCLDGDAKADTVKGGGGRDRVKGEGGGDTLRGQKGRDRVNGGGGRDDLTGGAKADSLRGGGGADKLRGGASRDRLRGNGGKDKIVAGGGKDKVNCGGGRDRVTAGPKDKVSDNCERVI